MRFRSSANTLFLASSLFSTGSMLSLHSAHATTLGKVTLNGYFSFEYEKTVSGDDKGDKAGSLDTDLLDLVFNIQATSKLRIATDLTWEHGSASEDDRGNVAVEYAFAEYLINDHITFRAGKMFTHFGIYNEIHTAKPATLTVKEPLSTNKNNKFGSELRFYPRWNTGIALRGRDDLGEANIDYIIQLSNGDTQSDVNPYEEDENSHKAVNARVRYATLDGLRLGLSLYSDTMADGTGTGEEVKLKSYGLQLESPLAHNLNLELEYVWGRVENSVTGDELDRSAYTLMLFHNTTSQLTPYVRYEFLEPNDEIDDDEGNIVILGMNYMLDKNLYLKFELDRFSTEAQNAKHAGADYTEFKSSISIGF